MKTTPRPLLVTLLLLSAPVHGQAQLAAETPAAPLQWVQMPPLSAMPSASIPLPEPTLLSKPQPAPLPWLKKSTASSVPSLIQQPALVNAELLPTPAAEPQVVETAQSPAPQIMPPQTIAQTAELSQLQPAANAPQLLPPTQTQDTPMLPWRQQATPAPMPEAVVPKTEAPQLQQGSQMLAQPAARPGANHVSMPEPEVITPVAITETEKESAFHEMLVYVYQQSPRLRAARYSLKAGDERVSEAVSGFRPTLSANGDIGRQREATGSDGWVYGTARDESLVLNQPIFNGNGTFAQFHAARARVSAERAHLITVEEQVFLDAITAYLDAVTKQEVLEFTRENRAHLLGYVTATDKRLKAGDGTKTDLAQAQSRLSQADTNVATAEANWLAACATYQRNTGMQMTSTRLPPLPDGLPDTVDEAANLARKAPEFTEAAEQERASSHDIDVASSTLWPTVSLRGAMSSQLTPSLGLQNLRNDSMTLNVSIPLYQGGAEHARVREARELREKAHEDMMDISRFMTERATQAWHNYYASFLVIDASGKSTDAAYRALQGIEIEHQQGLRTMQDTLDSRAEYLNSLIARAQAEQNLYLQAYRLLAATGQLTADALHLSTPIYDPKQHYDRVADKWAGTK